MNISKIIFTTMTAFFVQSGFALSPHAPLPASCTQFISAKGAMGPWGKVVKNKLSSEAKGILEFPFVPEICPNYQNLSDGAKWEVVVTGIATMSDMVSSCSPTAMNNEFKPTTPNKVGGLFALEKDRAKRRVHGADCDYSEDTPANQISCAMTILKKDANFFAEFKSPAFARKMPKLKICEVAHKATAEAIPEDGDAAH